MKRYCVKCDAGRVEFLDVLWEQDSGYMTRVIRIKDGYEKSIEEFMPRQLFESCLKTGYIYEMKEAASIVA